MNKEKKYYFPIIVNNDNNGLNRIHPLKQRKVDELIKYCDSLVVNEDL